MRERLSICIFVCRGDHTGKQRYTMSTGRWEWWVFRHPRGEIINFRFVLSSGAIPASETRSSTAPSSRFQVCRQNEGGAHPPSLAFHLALSHRVALLIASSCDPKMFWIASKPGRFLYQPPLASLPRSLHQRADGKQNRL